MDKNTFPSLLKRLGSRHVGKRLRLQAYHSAIRVSTTGIHIYLENIYSFGLFLKTFLQLCGLWHKATQTSLHYRVVKARVNLPRLPSAFNGFRILHLSDLHIEAIIDGGEKLRELIGQLHYDLCVITGDFRSLTYGDYQPALTRVGQLMKAIHCPHGTFAILGNHDFLEMVPGLEELGITMLLNEAYPIHRGGETIWIVGVDDPHWYEVHDLPKALESVPPGDLKLLLSHSPEIIQEAEEAGIDCYLCGHSHGGQICFPGGIPILTNSRCARTFQAGPWKFGQMSGHTSRGTGCSLIPVRIFCRPEIILHTLQGSMGGDEE